jgi:hypothetical protein
MGWLHVEPLEHRLAPATLTFIGTAANQFAWDNPADWSGGAIPTPSDNVIISGTCRLDNLDTSPQVASLTLKGAILHLDNDTLTASRLFWSGGTITGDPAGSVIINGGGTISGGVSLDAATLINQGGTLDLSHSSGSQGQVVLDHGTIDNSGNTNWTTNLNIDAQNGSVFDNQATGKLSILSGQTFTSSTSASPGSFSNEGVMIIESPSSATTEGTTTIDTAFTNSGLIGIRNATLNCAGGFTQTQGLTGIYGGKLEAPQVDLQGGLLGGNGTIRGDVNNSAGLITPVFAGQLKITGNFAEGAGGTLAFSLGGPQPGTDFGQILVHGDTTLDGTLAVFWLNGSRLSRTDVERLFRNAFQQGIRAFTLTDLGNILADAAQQYKLPSYSPQTTDLGPLIRFFPEANGHFAATAGTTSPNGITFWLSFNNFDLYLSAASTLFWTGNVNADWSNPGNWKEDRMPGTGDTLFFPSGARQHTHNDLPGLNLASVELEGSGYTLTGDTIHLSDFLDQQTGANTWNINTELDGAVTFKVVGTLNIASVLGDGANPGELDVVGPGTLSLEQDNTYTAGTYAQAGVTLAASSDDSFSTGTVKLSGDTALLNASAGVLALNNLLIFDGNVAIAAGEELSLHGNVELSSDSLLRVRGSLVFDQNTDIFTDNNDSLAFAGRSSGASNVNLNGTVNAPLFADAGAVLVLDGTLDAPVVLQDDSTVYLGDAATGVGLAGSAAINVLGGTLVGAVGNAGFAGAITLEAGAIEIDSGAMDPVGTGTLALDTAYLPADTGLLKNSTGNALTLNNAVQLDGDLTLNTGKQWTFVSSVQVAGNSVVKVTGRLVFASGSTIVGPALLTLDSDTSVNMAGMINANVTADGNATVTLNGTLDTAGVFVVDGRTLALLTTLNGNGAIFVQGGTLWGPTGNFNYTGTITLTHGVVQVSAPSDGQIDGGLGTGTLVLDGGAVKLIGKLAFALDNNVTIDGRVKLEAGTGLTLRFSVTVQAASTVTVSGALSLGPGTLAMGGSVLTMVGAAPAASVILGGTVNGSLVLAGALKVALDGTLAGASVVSVRAPAQLTLGTVQAGMQGSGAIDIVGGKLIAFTDNTEYAGNITLSSGTIQVSAFASGLGTGTLTLNGGTLDDTGKVVALTNPLTIAGNETFSATQGTLTLAQPVNVSGTSTVTLAPSSTIDFQGDLTGTTLDILGIGTVDVTANSVMPKVGRHVKLVVK